MRVHNKIVREGRFRSFILDIILCLPLIFSLFFVSSGTSFREQLLVHTMIVPSLILLLFLREWRLDLFLGSGILYLIYLFWNISVNPSGGLGLERWWEWLFFLLLYWVLFQFRTREGMNKLVTAVVGLLVISQMLVNLWNIVVDISLFETDFIFRNRAGLFANKNIAAGVSLLALGWFLFSERKFSRIIVCIIFFNMIVSGSRSGLLGALVIVGLFFWTKTRYSTGRKTLFLLLVILLIGGAVYLYRGASVFSAHYITNSTRVDIFKHGLDLFRSKMWTGWGLGSSGLIYTRGLQPGQLWELHFHNVFLQKLVEEGMLGLGLFILWLFAAARQVSYRGRIILAGFLTLLLFDELLWTLPVRTLFCALLVLTGNDGEYLCVRTTRSGRIVVGVLLAALTYFSVILPTVSNISFERSQKALDPAERVELSLKSYQIFPGSVTGIYLGIHLFRSGDAAAAEKVLREVGRVNPYDPFIPYTLGWMKIIDGDQEEGMNLVRRSWEMDPANIFSPAGIDLLYIKTKLGEEEEVRRILFELKRYFNHYLFRSWLADPVLQRGELAELNPGLFTHNDRLYGFYPDVWTVSELETSTAKGLEKDDPFNPEYRFLYGFKLLERDDTSAASRQFAIARRLGGFNPIWSYLFGNSPERLTQLIKEPYPGILDNVYRRRVIGGMDWSLSVRHRPTLLLPEEKEIIDSW